MLCMEFPVLVMESFAENQKNFVYLLKLLEVFPVVYSFRNIMWFIFIATC